MKIAFFDSKEYDKVSFDKVNNGKYDITYFTAVISVNTTAYKTLLLSYNRCVIKTNATPNAP